MAIKINPQNTTVIICCAGMGTRLGIGTTKALVDICGKPLIIRQLEQLEDYDDIRIVVGFDAERLVNIVKNYRKDIMFVFNYEYMHNGPADSLRKALLGAREYIISMDGDTVHNPMDFKKFLLYQNECVAVTVNASKETIAADIVNNNLVKLHFTKSSVQWSGIAKIKKEKLGGNLPHTYQMIDKLLPMNAFYLKLKEINTQEDYENAIEWFSKGMIL